MTQIAGSGSASGSESGAISQRHGSADPDPDPDPPQNIMDAQHWLSIFFPLDMIVFVQASCCSVLPAPANPTWLRQSQQR
jgi:hypothetical protein